MKSFLDLIKEEEQGEKHHVMTFGRMNPPTTGHMKLIHKVHEIADKNNATHTVVASHSQDAKKNPLSSAQKVKHLKRYSPDTNFKAASKEKPTILHHAVDAHKKGATHLHVVVGSDRVKEMHHILHKYNGVDSGHGSYHFKKITVHSAGQRDPDAEGTEGMSASKMREHAKNKDIKSFRQGVPSHVADHHAKELMHDVRKGMGLHEQTDRGMFKAVFVTGCPGSGKDVVIREAIAEARAVELNLIQAYDYLADKQKLSEKTMDYRREAIRSRGPLIINGPADNIDEMLYVKEELEELGYQTMMVFVNTTNEVSQERNTKLSRMMVESVRYDKWIQAQTYKTNYSNCFEDFSVIDNSKTIEYIEEDITETYQKINQFMDNKNHTDNAIVWLENHNKLNINESINSLFKDNNNVKKTSRFLENYKAKSNGSTPIRLHKQSGATKAMGPGDIPADNRASDPNTDNIKWDANKRRGTYIFRTYSEEAEKPETGTTLSVTPQPQETNFSKDKEKLKKKRFSDSPTVNQRIRNTTGLGPEFDTRQQGTVYPMSGLGDVTYREQKEFKQFRNKFKEAIDDPGAVDMGVGGVLGGSTNKEPMQSYKDMERNITTTIKKKKK
jgi:cytidyltransferase-like protein